MSSEVTASGILADSGIGITSAKISDCEPASETSDVMDSGGEAGGGGGVDFQKDRLRVDPSPTITLDRCFKA